MRLPTPTHYLVTLGGEDLVDPATVIDTMEYAHPLYTPTSVAAQRRLPEIDTDRVAFAGAYHGWGFHEDGARSGPGRRAAAGSPVARTPPALRLRRSRRPGLYDATIPHTRRTPVPPHLHQPQPDLAGRPRRPARPRGARPVRGARPPRGPRTRTIRANVEAFLAGHGVDVAGGRILMAANARAFGYCFNPISVFWCFDRRRASSPAWSSRCTTPTATGTPTSCTPTRRAGRAPTSRCTSRPSTAPTATTSSRCPCPASGCDIAVTLHTEDGEVFTRGLGRPAYPRLAVAYGARRAARLAPDPAARHLALGAPAAGARPRPDRSRLDSERRGGGSTAAPPCRRDRRSLAGAAPRCPATLRTRVSAAVVRRLFDQVADRFGVHVVAAPAQPVPDGRRPDDGAAPARRSSTRAPGGTG